MSFPVEASFNQVLEDCISGKLIKEQALKLLENKYKSAYVDIKQKFGKDRQSFCCYVPCDFEEWIEICDDTERNKPFHERKHSDAKIQRVINKYTAECKKNELKSKDCIIDVYSEVHQIQNWCRENRETKELYEKYKAEIEGKQDLKEIKADQINDLDYERNIFIQMLKEQSLSTYRAMKKAIETELVEYNDKYFNFRCSKGSVGLFFGKTGYNNHKMICQYVLINNDPCEQITLKNWNKNDPPSDWQIIEKNIISTTTK